MRKETNARQRPDRIQINHAIQAEYTRRWLKGTLIAMAIGLCVVGMIHVATPMRVQGSSMLPTLHAGEWMFVNRLTKHPQHGDIVVAMMDSEWVVKRVIGLPGDEINILQDGTVIRNGSLVAEDVAELSYEPCDITLPAIVPEDAFFLMGDNRAGSIDSRSSEVGMIQSEQMIGTVY